MIRIDRIPELCVIRRDTPRNEILGSKENMEPDAVFILEDDILGKTALVEKLTPYTNNPADLMLVNLERKETQITQLDERSRLRYFQILGMTANAFEKVTKEKTFICFNQQENCEQIAQKYSPDGTELKVQTINSLHAHIFSENFQGDFFRNLSELDQKDFYDFYDPLGMTFSEIVYREVVKKSGMDNLSIIDQQYPFGILLKMRGKFGEVPASDNLARMVCELQTRYSEIYNQIARGMEAEILGHDKKRRKDSFQKKLPQLADLSKPSQRIVKTIFLALKDDPLQEEKKYLRFVQGSALTWIITQNQDFLEATLSPKVLSRGNAMEALGIWVEQAPKNNPNRQAIKQSFYQLLEIKLAKNFTLARGNAFSKIIG